MTRRILNLFTDKDLDRIRGAVAEAESRTSGEIVPYVVRQSDDYEIAMWRAGMLFGFASLALFVILRAGTGTWLPLDLSGVILLGLLAGVVAMFLARLVAPFRRWLAGEEMLDRRVAQRAVEAFLDEEMFKTRDRTGILLFVSLMEHKVFVLADAGINEKVGQGDWDAISGHLVAKLRRGNATDGLVEAIGMSADLLAGNGFARQTDDRNELENRLRGGKK